MDQHEEVEAVEPNDSAEQVDPRDEKLRIWKFSLQKPRLANATPCCASKRKWKTCAVVLNRISKKRINSLEKFVNELLPVIDSPDRALEVADKANPDMAAMVEGIELTLKSMLDVVRKFGVEVIAETNVPLDPNVHQAIAMVESEEVPAGNVLGIMQKGYTLNGRTIRAAMVTVAKAK